MSHYSAHSFNDIYNSYYQKAFMYVKSYVHDDMVAEDIVSESLVKLWEKSKKETIDPVAPYLFIILKNRSLDYLKHLKVRQYSHTDIVYKLDRELEIRMNSLDASDPAYAFSNEVQAIIENTLKSLPKRTREVFIMSRFEGKTHKEIASNLNITVKGVDYHIAQSVRVLRVSLADYLPIISILGFL